jgi:hypothetical protein
VARRAASRVTWRRFSRGLQSLLALEAAANVLDTELTQDLATMITRSETELVALNAKIEALGD